MNFTKSTVAVGLAVPVIFGTVAAPAATTASSAQATVVTADGDRSNRAPSRSKAPYRFASYKYNQWYATQYMQYKYGWGKKERKALVKLWNKESGWNEHARNPSSGAHGIPQSLPGSKMASHGKDWYRNPETQIKWGLSYIKGRYGTPSKAWNHSVRVGWY